MGNIRVTRIATDDGFQILDLFIDGNGFGDYQDLARLQMPPGMDWSLGVVVNGKVPQWLQAWAMSQCPAAPWLAAMDPRHGGIVIRAGHAGPGVAEVIPRDTIVRSLPAREPVAPAPVATNPSPACRVVAFVGPPHSGKSVLIRAVHERLRETLPAEEFQRDVFLVRACPDGEGNWSGEIPLALAATLRYKNHWDEEFVDGVIAQIENLSTTKGLLLVDFGGRIDRSAQRIMACCNAAVIVSRDAVATAEWRGALHASGIEVLAEIESVLDEARDVLGRDPLRLRLGPLERGRDVNALPDELTQAIVAPRMGEL